MRLVGCPSSSSSVFRSPPLSLSPSPLRSSTTGFQSACRAPPFILPICFFLRVLRILFSSSLTAHIPRSLHLSLSVRLSPFTASAEERERGAIAAARRLWDSSYSALSRLFCPHFFAFPNILLFLHISVQGFSWVSSFPFLCFHVSLHHPDIAWRLLASAHPPTHPTPTPSSPYPVTKSLSLSIVTPRRPPTRSSSVSAPTFCFLCSPVAGSHSCAALSFLDFRFFLFVCACLIVAACGPFIFSASACTLLILSLSISLSLWSAGCRADLPVTHLPFRK